MGLTQRGESRLGPDIQQVDQHAVGSPFTENLRCFGIIRQIAVVQVGDGQVLAVGVGGGLAVDWRMPGARDLRPPLRAG